MSGRSDLSPSITVVLFIATERDVPLSSILIIFLSFSLALVRRHLLGTLNYLDMTRVGVWGWGYGGYVTAMLMGSQQEVFKCGVSVSPIVDWLYYSKRATTVWWWLFYSSSSDHD